MNLILCSDAHDRFWQEVISATSAPGTPVVQITNESELIAELAKAQNISQVLIEATLCWPDNYRHSFFGFTVACRLRRQYFITCPIAIIGFFGEATLRHNETTTALFRLVEAGGADFISYPFSLQGLQRRLSNLKHLSQARLIEVVTEGCGLNEEWQRYSHKLMGWLTANSIRKHQAEVKLLLKEWRESIQRFAPHAFETFEELQHSITHLRDPKHSKGLRELLQRLDGKLLGIQPWNAGKPIRDETPPQPPEGFTKVLIADDEPQRFLILSLRTYGYDVLEQAFKRSEAIQLLSKENPDIVLSDLYFKESTRLSEDPQKSVGLRFIRQARTHPQYANSNPQKPILALISKAPLRTATDVPDGVLNCSGARAEASFIHGQIWAEARRRGVNRGSASRSLRRVELEWRLKLQTYESELPRLIYRWKRLPEVITETLSHCQAFGNSQENDNPAFVNEVIGALELHASKTNLSTADAEQIFSETERLWRLAQKSADNSARQILNILHGKIEQFRSNTKAITTLVDTYKEIANEMAAEAKCPQLRKQLRSQLAHFSASQSPLRFLFEQRRFVRFLLSKLPEAPQTTARAGLTEPGTRRVNVVVVEDDEFWRDFIAGAIEKARLQLGPSFNITAQFFDNSADAIKAIPRTSKAFAIAKRSSATRPNLVIADIRLPRNRSHVKRIRVAAGDDQPLPDQPSKIHGLNLIKRLASFDYDLPLIVLSDHSTIRDRAAISAFGVSDSDFLAKGTDDEDSLVRAFIRKVEKKNKYIIKRTEDNKGVKRFVVNGLEIPLSNELAITIFALLDLHQTTGKNSFSTDEIIERRGDARSRKVIQNHISRLRKAIAITLKRNGVYVDSRDILRTLNVQGTEEFNYQLNAEITPIEEESDYEDDVRRYKTSPCKVLIVEDDIETQQDMAEALQRLGYETIVADNVEDAVRLATDAAPDIVSLDLQIPHGKVTTGVADFSADESAGLDAWRQIRLTSGAKVGIVVPTANADQNHLIAQAAQMEIPIRNFVLKRDPAWFSVFLKKVSDERQRLFLGEITDVNADVAQPIIEILDGSDLSGGVLRLAVSGYEFSMRLSPISKIIGALLTNPGTVLTLKELKIATGSRSRPTKNDSKNWTKRIRSIIKAKWLPNSKTVDQKVFAEQILQSSAKGLRLNVQVLDLRPHSR